MNWRSFHGQTDTVTKLQRVIFFVFSTKRRPLCGIQNNTVGRGKGRRTEQNAQKYKFSLCVFLPLFVVSAVIEKMLCGTIFASK